VDTQTNCLDEQGKTQDGAGTGEKQVSGSSGIDKMTIAPATTVPTICDRRTFNLSTMHWVNRTGCREVSGTETNAVLRLPTETVGVAEQGGCVVMKSAPRDLKKGVA